jgi:hypothetical protein
MLDIMSLPTMPAPKLELVKASPEEPQSHAFTREDCTLDGRACKVGVGKIHRCASCAGRGWWRICNTHPQLDNCGCRGTGQHVTKCVRCDGLGGMVACPAPSCRGFGNDSRLSRHGREIACPVCHGCGTRPARWTTPPIPRHTTLPCGYCRSPQLETMVALRSGDSSQPIEQFRRVDGTVVRLADPFSCTVCGHGWVTVDFARVVLL